MSILLQKGTTKLFLTLHKLVMCLQELAEKGDLQDKQPLLDLMDMIIPEEIEKKVVHLTLRGEKWLCIMLRKKPEEAKKNGTDKK